MQVNVRHILPKMQLILILGQQRGNFIQITFSVQVSCRQVTFTHLGGHIADNHLVAQRFEIVVFLDDFVLVKILVQIVLAE